MVYFKRAEFWHRTGSVCRITDLQTYDRRALQERKERKMNEANDGGPAFPVPSEDSGPGMSLRDWFAGRALSALADRVKDEELEGFAADVATDIYQGGEEEARKRLLKGACREASELAYMLADALLQARQDPESDNE